MLDRIGKPPLLKRAVYPSSSFFHFEPNFPLFAEKAIMFACLFRKPKFAPVPQTDNETLLPSSSSTSSLPLEKANDDRKTGDLRVAVNTFVLSTAVYITVGVWIALSARSGTFVWDADDFCINHVSQYCKCSANEIYQSRH